MWKPEQCRLLVGPLGVTLLLLAGCGHGLQIVSHWTANPIAVDGADADWGDRRYAPENLPITFSVTNDASHLYVYVMTNDRPLQMRVLRSGIELWLDPKGGDRNYFGIRLPGADVRSLPPLMGWGENSGLSGGFGGQRSGGVRRRSAGQSRPDKLTQEQLAELLGELTNSRHVLILDALDDEGWQITPGAGDPVQARLGFEQGRLIYEARVPLKYTGHPAFELADKVGLALRLPAPPVPMELGGPEGGDTFAGGAGRGGGFGDVGEDHPAGGAGGRRTGRGRRVPIEAMEKWVQVQLYTQ